MSRTKSKASSAGTDDYLELVRGFPLRPIRGDADAARAAEILRGLLARAEKEGLTAGESDYADALGVFLRDYDHVHASILQGRKKSPPIEILKFLMDQHAMNVTALGKLLGSGSGQASLVLRGKRELSKSNIRVLAEFFRVSPALFI